MLGPRSDQHDPVVIVGAARTAMGALQGALADFSAPRLGAVTIRSVARAGVAGEEVSEVLMGAILTAGQGQAPARQAALAAGLPHAVPATTVNKMCGSGMKTVMMAADALLARPAEVIVAGGMESMSKAPYLVPKMRQGARLGHAEMKDHMFLDGLEDAYDRDERGRGRLMGVYAEATAEAYQFTRAEQDAYALESLGARARPTRTAPSLPRSRRSRSTGAPARRSSRATSSRLPPIPPASRS